MRGMDEAITVGEGATPTLREADDVDIARAVLEMTVKPMVIFIGYIGAQSGAGLSAVFEEVTALNATARMTEAGMQIDLAPSEIKDPAAPHKRVPFDPSDARFLTFDNSVHKGNILFVIRNSAEITTQQIESLIPRLSIMSAMQDQDWRLQHAYEWNLVERRVLAGQLRPELPEKVVAPFAWRLDRSVARSNGDQMLQWSMIRLTGPDGSTAPRDAVPLATTITNNNGEISRAVDRATLMRLKMPAGSDGGVVLTARTPCYRRHTVSKLPPATASENAVPPTAEDTPPRLQLVK